MMIEVKTIKHCGNCKFYWATSNICASCLNGDKWEMQDYSEIDRTFFLEELYKNKDNNDYRSKYQKCCRRKERLEC